MSEYSPEPVDKIDSLLQECLGLFPDKPESREQAVAITNLEQTIMWYRKHHFKNVKN